MPFPALLAMLGRLGGTAAGGGAGGGLLGGLGGGSGLGGLIGQAGNFGGLAGRLGSIAENVGTANGATPPPVPYQGKAFEAKAFEPKEFSAKPFSLNPADADKENARLDAHNKKEAQRKQKHDQDQAKAGKEHDSGEGDKKRSHDAKQRSVVEKEAATKSQAAGRAIGQMADMAAKIPGPIGLANKAMDLVSSKFKELVTNMAAPIAFVQELGNTLSQFTSKSNPGQFARFGLVMNDAFAALGKGLEPLMEFVIRLGSFVGDMFAKFAPVLESISGLVAKFGDTMTGMYKTLFDDVLTALKPFIDMFIFYIDNIAPVVMKLNPLFLIIRLNFELLGKALLLATWPLRQFIKVLQALGIVGKGAFDKDASSKGMAAQNFSVSSSADDFQRDMAVKALSSNGPGDAKKPDEAIVELPNLLTEISTKITKFMEQLSLENLAGLLLKQVWKNSAPGMVAGGAEDAWNWIRAKTLG